MWDESRRVGDEIWSADTTRRFTIHLYHREQPFLDVCDHASPLRVFRLQDRLDNLYAAYSLIRSTSPCELPRLLSLLAFHQVE